MTNLKIVPLRNLHFEKDCSFQINHQRTLRKSINKIKKKKNKKTGTRGCEESLHDLGDQQIANITDQKKD